MEGSIYSFPFQWKFNIIVETVKDIQNPVYYNIRNSYNDLIDILLFEKNLKKE